MSNNKNSNNNKDNKSIDQSLIREFLEVQKEQISAEKSKTEVQKQHIKSQTEIAKQSISVQEKLLTKAPDERRKDRAQLLRYGIFILAIVLCFSIFCLIYGHGDYLKFLIGSITHILTLLIGYYFGNKNSANQNKENSEIYEDAEIIDD